MWTADAFDRKPTEYDDRINFEDRRAIKRLIRATPKLSQVIRSMALEDDGTVEVIVGNPMIGSVLVVTRINHVWTLASRQDFHLN